MRLHRFLLLGLMIVAACDAALAVRRQLELRVLPPALAETHPASDFAARLESVTDPAELRRLALARHRSLLEADHISQALLTALRTLSRSDAIQAGAIFLIAVAVSWTGRGSPRP